MSSAAELTEVTRMLQPRAAVESANGTGGLWTIRDGAATPLSGEGPATLLVPGEAVLLLAADLPLPTRARRLAALPFAVEERIADPLDAVHLALGNPLSAHRHLVGVVRHDAMQGWLALAAEAGLADAALVPDTLALPLPPEGRWAVARTAERILARRHDGTAFALPPASFEAAWSAAGRPELVDAPFPTAGPFDLDLRQGVYARIRRVSDPWRRVATVAALGLAAHALIAAADTLALTRIADRWRSETMAQVALVRPGLAVDEATLAATAADLVPADTGAPGPLLPLLTRAATALAPAGVTLRALRFDGATLGLEVTGPDESALTRAAAALARAGLAPRRAPAAPDATGPAALLTVRTTA